MTTEPGEGTTFTLRLPVTLAIVRALLARVGDERYALPLTHVRETVAVVATVGAARCRGATCWCCGTRCCRCCGCATWCSCRVGRAAMAAEIVVLERGDRRAGLVVDELTGQEDIVVKPFDAVRGRRDALQRRDDPRATGAPALIVDVGSLL